MSHYTRRISATITVACMTLVPSSASACPACADLSARLVYPFIDSLIPAFLIWLTASFVLAALIRSRTGGPVHGLTALRRFAYIGLPLLAFGVFVMAPRALGLPLIVVWCLYLVRSTVMAFGRRSPMPLMPANLAALAVTVVAIPWSYIHAATTPVLVDWIGHAPPHGATASRFVLKPVIARGESTVPLLRRELDEALSHGGWGYSMGVPQLCYCLARIGGQEATGALESAVATVKFDDEADFRVQAVACCAYAECARGGAVPSLTQLFLQASGPRAIEQQAIVLCALARTADPAAMETVLANAEIIQKARDENLVSGLPDLCNATLIAVLDGKQAIDLVRSPIYRAIWLGIDEEAIPDASAARRTALDWSAMPEITPERVEAAQKRWSSELHSDDAAPAPD